MGSLAVTHVAVSVSGVIVGLLLGAVIYVIGQLLTRSTGEGAFVVIAAILGVLVFVMTAFDFYGD